MDNRKGRNPIEGWWNWGGIVRPVTVSSVGRLSATSLSVTGNLPCVGCEGELVGQVIFHNRGRRTIADPVDAGRPPRPLRHDADRARPHRPAAAEPPPARQVPPPRSGAVQTWSPSNPGALRRHRPDASSRASPRSSRAPPPASGRSGSRTAG
ncbi:MAG: hypothetical protein WKF31_04515 [Thermoleophilaceae bacterium]